MKGKNNKKAFLIGIITICLLAFSSPALADAPHMSSQYYCLVDRETGYPILARNADVLRPVASTTKMMTAILAVEYANLNEIAIVSKNADLTPEYTIGLRQGQEIKVGELLKVALIRSSNDAAVVLAEHVAGDEAFFAYLMSKKAFVIGAMRTRFKNASGLPQKDHYSTAYDLSQIGRYALSKPDISTLVASTEVKFKHPGYSQPLIIHNTNGLLGSFPGVDGIKTGTADAAGKCLVASASRKNRGLIAVALKSADRDSDCARLLDYGFNHTQRSLLIDHNAVFKNLRINKAIKSYVEIFPDEDLWLWLGDKRPDIEKVVRIDYSPQVPLKKGSKAGELDVYVEGRYVASIDLVSREDVAKEPSFGRRLLHKFLSQVKGNKVSSIE